MLVAPTIAGAAMAEPSSSSPSSYVDSVHSYLSSQCSVQSLFQGQSLSLYLQDSLFLWLVFDLSGRSVNVLNLSLLPEFEEALRIIEREVKSDGKRERKREDKKKEEEKKQEEKKEEKKEEKRELKIKPRALILASNKFQSFIAGADLEVLAGNVDAKLAEEGSLVLQRLLDRVEALHLSPSPSSPCISSSSSSASLSSLSSSSLSSPFSSSSPFFVVAALNGATLGAGLELSLSCSHRFSSSSPKVSLGLPEVKLGLLPGAGGTLRLPRLIGFSSSLPLLLSGNAVSAKKALELGLIDAVLPWENRRTNEHRFYATVREVCAHLIAVGSLYSLAPPSSSSSSSSSSSFSSSSSSSSPSASFSSSLSSSILLPPQHNSSLSTRFLDHTAAGRFLTARLAARDLDEKSKGLFPAPYLALDAAYRSFSLEARAALNLEADYFGRLSVTPQSKALIALFFMLEKAKKRPTSIQDARAERIACVGVLGAGVMGRQIAMLCANRGFSVILRDLNQDIVSSAAKSLDASFADKVKRKRMSADKANKTRALIRFTVDLSLLNECDLVIEAAVERMEVKQAILRELEPLLKERAIFATNTSALSVKELASVSRRPQQVLGFHLFNPVSKMPLVELITPSWSLQHSQAATLFDLAQQLSKLPLLVPRDAPGFIVNRLLALFMNEGGRLACEGFSFRRIDVVWERWGAPMGPFALLDHVGLDVAAHVGQTLQQKLGERFRPSNEYSALLSAHPDLMGKKSGAGFYVYSEQGKLEHENVTLSHQLTQLLRLKAIMKPRLSEAAERALLLDRGLLLMINEAIMMLEEGVASSAEVIDLALITGAGFAVNHGGLLNYADRRGIEDIVHRLRVLQATYGERYRPHPTLVSMASQAQRFYPDRPRASQLKPVTTLPRSRL